MNPANAIPFEPVDFDTLTARALKLAEDLESPYRDLLKLLDGCEVVYSGPLAGQQQKGATYRQLAAAAQISYY